MMPETMAGPVQGVTPPDQQPRPVRDILVELDAAIWANKTMDPQEQMDLRTFYEAQMLKVQAMQQGQAPGPGLGFQQAANQNGVGAQQPQAPQDTGETEDAWGNAGDPMDDEYSSQNGGPY